MNVFYDLRVYCKKGAYMHLRTGIFTLLFTLSATLACAGPGGQGSAGGGTDDGSAAPKPGRLGVPTNVACTKAGDQLTLTWDAVAGAQQYRVYLEADDGGDLVDTVPMPPYTHPLSDMSEDATVAVKAHVRALASKMGRDASRPSAHVTCE
jgi:hypothetical protein